MLKKTLENKPKVGVLLINEKSENNKNYNIKN